MNTTKKHRRRRNLEAYNPAQLPDILPPEDDRYLVNVYVEGYEDVLKYRYPTEMTYLRVKRC